jgi:MFS family permease
VQHRSLKSVRLSVSSIFLIHGLVVASWASQIPVFQGNLHLSPLIVGRLLMMAAAGSVFAMPIAGWLIHRFGSTCLVIVTTLGFCLSLPSIAAAGSVLTLSIALPFYGAMSGSMDVAMNTHAVLLEKQYQRHIMSSFHALFSFGGMIGSALGALATSKGMSAGAHLWSSGIALAMASMVAFKVASASVKCSRCECCRLARAYKVVSYALVARGCGLRDHAG